MTKYFKLYHKYLDILDIKTIKINILNNTIEENNFYIFKNKKNKLRCFDYKRTNESNT